MKAKDPHLRGPKGRLLFRHLELCCPETGVVKLATGFGELLVALRCIFGEPMPAISCCRSAEHNAKIGGHDRSLHVWDKPHHPVDGTCAIDISTVSIHYAWRLIGVAHELGWSYGIKPGMVHLDRRELAGLRSGAFGYR